MKTQILILVLVGLSTWVFGQENRVILSGGYSFLTLRMPMKMEPAGELMGYMNTILKKENGRMVFPWDTFISLGMPMEDWRHMKLVHGPFTMLEKLKGFIKGAIGAHFSSLKRSGPLGELSDNDFGFAGGAGLGGSYFINEKIFLNAEYELLWLSNAYYVEGLLNTASLGIGFRF